MDVFCARIAASSVGITAPLIILSLLLYLLFLVRHLAGSRRALDAEIIVPWVGLSKDWLAICLTFLTVVILPAIAIWVAIHFLLGLDRWIAPFAAVLFALSGGWLISTCLKAK